MSVDSRQLSFDDLEILQRLEIKYRGIVPVRPDLYKAMTELRQNLHDERSRIEAKDPDSIMCEGAKMHSKRADTMCKMICNTRAQKICTKALISADGGTVEVIGMTEEEMLLFSTVKNAAEKYLALGSAELKTYIPEPEPEAIEVKKRDRRSAREMMEMLDQIREYQDGFTSDEFASRFSLKQATAKEILRRWKDRGAVNLIGVSGLFNIYRSVEYTDTPRFNRVNRRTKVSE